MQLRLTPFLLLAGALALHPGCVLAQQPTLTLTAVSLAFHQGDPVPPLIFEGSGYRAGDTFATATSTGRPALSTTAVAASPPGAYPIRITAGSTTSRTYSIQVVPGTMTVLPPDGTGARTNSYTYPDDAMVSVKKFGATGDGRTDDTAAINRALTDGRADCKSDYFRNPKILYFPPGRYRVSGQLTFCGAEMSLRGAGPTESVLYLAPRTPDFAGPKPTPLLLFPSASTARAYGNISFRNFVSALGIDIGEGNPGAIGLDVVMNNVGAIEDVIVTDEESSGPTGINLTHAWNGPMLVKNVAVYGFNAGFTLGQQQYSSVYSHITTEGQAHFGFLDAGGQAAAIEQMYSCNRVPAAFNTAAEVAIINSTFDCGAPAASAFVGHPQSSQHLRNIRVHGYGTSIEDNAATKRSGNITEYITGQPRSAFGSGQAASLNLPVQETPVVRDPKSGWIALSTTDPSRWSSQLAACSSSTAYLAAGEYTIAAQTIPVTIPSCIHHLQLFNAGYNPPRAEVALTVTGSASDPPLTIENAGPGFSITHASARTLVLRHVGLNYNNPGNAGTLFLEDVQTNQVHFTAGQHIWARQYDNEWAAPPPGGPCHASPGGPPCLPPTGVKVTCAGCSLWILGPKTEKGATNFQLTAGAKMELFGGFFLPLQANQQPDSTVIESTDSAFSADFMQFLYPGHTNNSGTAHIVRETRNGVTKFVDPPDQNTTFRTSMVVSAQH